MPTQWVVRAGGLNPASSWEELEALLFAQRGLEKVAIDHFFNPEYSGAIHDPFLLHQMQEAVDRIFHAAKKQEKVVIYGDYDADGVTSTAILISVLRDIGIEPIPYLPHRLDDGYSLNRKVLEVLEPDLDLLITVDCGVSNIEEVAWLKEKGKDVIVVDHHEMAATLPVARAVLHPRNPNGTYPWGFLCGAGMAWKLAQALLRDKRSGHHQDEDKEKWLLDLAMIGTVADIVSLQDENRAIVTFGLEVLRRSKRQGLRAMLKKVNLLDKKLTSEDVAFRIVPRLNAPGRLDHPQPALNALLETDPDRADELVLKLEEYNQQRQLIAKKVLKEAEAQVILDLPFVFAHDIRWNAGIVGLAAGKLAEKFGRPAIVIGGNGRHAVGSARSPVGTSVLALLESGREHLLKLGGHKQAAGFSVDEDKLNVFFNALTNNAEKILAQREDASTRFADAVVSESLLTTYTAEKLSAFEPFGEGNKRPMFVIKNLQVISSKTVGKKADHGKFVFDCNGSRLDGIGFGLGEKLASLKEKVDVIASPDINSFGGYRRLQLQIKEIEPAGTVMIQEEKTKVEARATS